MSDPDKRKRAKKRPIVVSRHGRYPFQRGIVTAALLRRGLSMEQAFTLSGEVRRRLADRAEVAGDELDAIMDALVRERLGLPALVANEPRSDGPSGLWRAPSRSRPPAVRIRGERRSLPFSRGVLLRRLTSAGLAVEPAISLANETRRWLRGLGQSEVSKADLAAFVYQRLLERHGEDYARRHRLIGWIPRAAQPVILMVGGATGTGKSTLATELAFRLGIHMVTRTDAIRETMRAALSPEVVPGLHDHSFRGMIQGGQVFTNPRERVLVGFRQQAAQVSVGIRAAIRRAIRENTHLIIEGTHLLPPFSQYLPPGAEVYTAGLVLSVTDERTHRERFTDRARDAAQRPAATYLDAFQAVRWIHDDLTHMADEADVLVLTERQVDETLQGVIGYLSEVLPVDQGLAASGPVAPDIIRASSAPTLFLILDGMPDEPNPALGDQTPLQAAHTPTLGALAAAGAQGLIQTASVPGTPAGTDEGLMALLGDLEPGEAPPKRLGRGLIEALGQGVPLPREGVVFRGNLATLQDDGVLVDRRAGRIREGAADLLSELQELPLGGGVRGHIYPGHEHRVVVLLQGPGLSAAVSDTDPGERAAVQRLLPATPRDDDPASARTARALEQLLQIACRHLASHPLNAERRARGLYAANCIITRGAASLDSLPRPRPDGRRVAMVSGCGTALGVARAFGFQPASSHRMTGNLDTDLDLKFETAGKLIGEHDLVAVHIKGTDIAAHDRQPLAKRDFLERIDQALGRFLQEREGLRVVISSDHPTSSRSGNHGPDPVPVLIATWEGADEEAAFDEESARAGVLGLLGPGELAGLLREG